MPTYGIDTLPYAITTMLNANEGLIAKAIDKKTTMNAWIAIGAAVVVVVLLVKRMGK